MRGWGEAHQVFRTLQQLVEAVRRESIPLADSPQQHSESASDRCVSVRRFAFVSQGFRSL
jgi:hypothetical protein